MERAILDEQMFEKRIGLVCQALDKLTSFPIPDEGAALWDFPEHLQHWGLSVLREAARRCRSSRTA
jgi:hypothetical protein